MPLQLWSETARKICKNAAGKLFRFSLDCCDTCDTCPDSDECTACEPKATMDNSECGGVGIFTCGFIEEPMTLVMTLPYCTYNAFENVDGKLSTVTIMCHTNEWILTARCDYGSIKDTYEYPEPIPSDRNCCFPADTYVLDRVDGSDCQEQVTVIISY